MVGTNCCSGSLTIRCPGFGARTKRSLAMLINHKSHFLRCLATQLSSKATTNFSFCQILIFWQHFNLTNYRLSYREWNSPMLKLFWTSIWLSFSSEKLCSTLISKEIAERLKKLCPTTLLTKRPKGRRKSENP